MSWNQCPEPECPAPPQRAAIDTEIVPRARDIGAFEVRRTLPSARRQAVGPFVFFDQMGPAEFAAGQGMDVRPHPHIGLATVTYLYQGAIMHRDSLGNALEIEPGAVNWMIAGSGITHSERTAPERRRAGERLFGIQTWVALPKAFEETAPAFEHVAEDDLPLLNGDGRRVRLILGSLDGERVPVKTFSEMFYADALLQQGARLDLAPEHEERGMYIVGGDVEITGQHLAPGRMLVFRPGQTIVVKALTEARLMLLGGEPLDGPRYIWWNFVASSRDRIEAAKRDWAAKDWANGRFQLPPADHGEHIPLPSG